MPWLIGIAILVIVVGYWIGIRPLLRSRPAFAEFYDATDSFWAALFAKLRTIRTKLTTVLGVIASALVYVDSSIVPLLTSSGIDWTPLTQHVPQWAWPLLSAGWLLLIFYFKSLGDTNNDKVVTAVEAGASVSEAKIAVGIMPDKAATL